jgi:hypothetical protein
MAGLSNPQYSIFGLAGVTGRGALRRGRGSGRGFKGKRADRAEDEKAMRDGVALVALAVRRWAWLAFESPWFQVRRCANNTDLGAAHNAIRVCRDKLLRLYSRAMAEVNSDDSRSDNYTDECESDQKIMHGSNLLVRLR